MTNGKRMSIVINAANVTVIEKVRKCGACGNTGHDKRNCPTVSVPKKDTAKEDAEKEANHLRFMSRVERGPCRLTNPTSYWAKLGPDSGTNPFLRDFKGALHLPKIACDGGGHTDHKELMQMPEYTWDAGQRLFIRNGKCPGCA